MKVTSDRGKVWAVQNLMEEILDELTAERAYLEYLKTRRMADLKPTKLKVRKLEIQGEMAEKVLAILLEK